MMPPLNIPNILNLYQALCGLLHIPGGKSASSWLPLPSPPPQNDIGSGSDIDGISLLSRLLFRPVQSDHDCIQVEDQWTEALIGQSPVILNLVLPAPHRCCDKAAILNGSGSTWA